MSDKYKNEKGVYIDVHTDNRGKDHVDFYSNDPKEDHSSIHINWDSSTGKGTISDTTSGSKETTDTKCYVTTACMRNKMENFDDNCEELTILRWLRDQFATKEDIYHYYTIAPMIVAAINDTDIHNEIYNYIYENVVTTCVNAIKKGDYNFAYNRYKNSMIALEEEFIRPKLNNKLVRVLKLKTNS